MKYRNFSDEELIARLRSGEAEIADYLMEKYKPLVRKKTNAMYLIGGENEDLIQEGMIGLFKAMRDYNQEKECSFFSFADLCISRQLYSTLESSNRKKHMPLNTYVSFSVTEEDGEKALEQIFTAGTKNPEDILIEQEMHKEFFARLQERLSTMEKTVLYMYLEGKSYTHIGEILGKPAKSIDNTLQRIRGKIKSLKELEG